MYFRLVKAELMKLRRSPVWLAFLVLPVIPALLGTLNYLGNIEILQSEWYSLWTQHTLFTDYIFLPVLIGVYCAYTMYMEQREHGWNKLLSVPARKSAVYAAKLTVAAVMIFVSEVWIAALYFASGGVAGRGTVGAVLSRAQARQHMAVLAHGLRHELQRAAADQRERVSAVRADLRGVHRALRRHKRRDNDPPRRVSGDRGIVYKTGVPFSPRA